MDACRRAGLKFGFYFSVEEWEYPIIVENGEKKVRLWAKEPEDKLIPYNEKDMRGKITGKIPVKNFIDDYIYPQAIEFIDRYDPDILWFDGEWDRPADYYRTREITAYFYNNAEGRKEVAVNDRLGKGERDLHGDFFTSEYGNRASEYYGSEKIDDAVHKWEECRGISQSFGYNREDTDKNVQTSQQLIHMLIDIVSRNGNLILITNLDGNGAMPEIYQKRLNAAGNWLSKNGEAIYGARQWKVPGEDDTILYTRKQDAVYAISIRWPGKRLALSSVTPTWKTAVTMPGREGVLPWRYDGGILYIETPEMPSGKEEYAYVFKITGVE